MGKTLLLLETAQEELGDHPLKNLGVTRTMLCAVGNGHQVDLNPEGSLADPCLCGFRWIDFLNYPLCGFPAKQSINTTAYYD
jgi:hypothetical protein